jgi:hypothetical protein
MKVTDVTNYQDFKKIVRGKDNWCDGTGPRGPM